MKPYGVDFANASLDSNQETSRSWVLATFPRGFLIEKTDVAADLKDQGCDGTWTIRQVSQLELFELAAKRIRGAGVFTSEDRNYVGAGIESLNAKRLANGDSFRDVETAVVVAGASPSDFKQAYEEVLDEGESLSLLLALRGTDTLVNYVSPTADHFEPSEVEAEIFDAYMQDTNAAQ